jgi:hypothetical protein
MNLQPVTVKIGGKLFTTVYNNLKKSGLFREMINTNILSDTWSSGSADEILCDLPQRSANNFKKVLAYLNDEKHLFPTNLSYELADPLDQVLL